MKKKKKIIIILIVIVLIIFLFLYKEGYSTYKSQNESKKASSIYKAGIGVSLLENGEIINSRDYYSDGTWSGNDEGNLFKNLLGENDAYLIGKTYNEEICAKNTGTINEYVRIIITKSWQDTEGKRATNLSADFIELNFLENTNWVIAEGQSTQERVVAYYKKILETGESTDNIINGIRLNEEIKNEYNITNNDGNIEITKIYDGYSFEVSVEIDAVQTHNAVDAIKSAWGVDVTINDNGEIIEVQ